MTIQECYQVLHGDYEDVCSRFRTEERITKFILKFLNDSSFESLQETLKAGNMEDAFRAAHTLKGLSLNLGFAKLAESSSLLTSALLEKDTYKINPLLSQVSEDYLQVIQAIQAFQASI